MKAQQFIRQSGWERSGFSLALIGVLLVGLSGCVSSGKYEKMVQERDLVLEQKAQLEAEKNSLVSEKEKLLDEQSRLNALVSQTEQQKQEAARQAKAAQEEIARQKAVYEGLQKTFAKEQQNNQVKIEMMKSGVKVNLASEILFPSGSAELNAQGVEVLTRAAEELKKSPYQTIVAGFTDNVAISGKLMERYPTNWELAGARAASVVRLLEKEGVASAQLLAISFGENSPVESNETPEGRSRNRRIEIVLRPVAITTNQ